jgi:hypothetical protein
MVVLFPLTGCSQLPHMTPDPVVSAVSEPHPGVYQVTGSGSKLDNWANIYGDAVREAQNFCQSAGQAAHITSVDHHFEQRVRPLVVVTNFECVAAS